jgi:hypothetical protein
VRGDVVPPSTRWQGNPIRPWNLVRKTTGKKPSRRGVEDSAA